jgi:serine/threonine-protein kinase HipA
MAKFPHKDDEINTVLWEAVALKLAGKASIPVPDWRLEQVTDKPVLLLRRFDRAAKDGGQVLRCNIITGARFVTCWS